MEAIVRKLEELEKLKRETLNNLKINEINLQRIEGAIAVLNEINNVKTDKKENISK